MSLSKQERKNVAKSEAIASAIASKKELSKEDKKGVDLVGLAEKLAERNANKGK